jgi:hypothetical protein
LQAIDNFRARASQHYTLAGHSLAQPFCKEE